MTRDEYSSEESETRSTTPLSEQCSVVIVPYNHEDLIGPCVESVLQCNPKEVLVVDGGSTDDTRDIVREMSSPVELITVDGNPGYGGCNNIGAEHATGEYLLVLNPDTLVEEGTIERLLESLGPPDSGPTVTVPKILTYDGSMINTIGNINHVTGLAFIQGFEDSPSDWSVPRTLTALSGACFAIRRRDFERLGGFEDAIFLYMDDVEFSWRLNALGERIQYVPESIVYHDYDAVEVDASKLKHLEIGRYTILRKYLSREDVLRLLPSLLMTEILTLGFAVLLGSEGVKGKIEAVRAAIENEVEPVDVDGRRLILSLDHEIPSDQLGDSLPETLVKRFANVVYWLNIRMIDR